MKELSKSDWPFLLLLLGVAALRVFLLHASQHSLSGDEATVGIVAKHILEGKDLPVFAYGEDYNGGSAMVAYAAAAAFKVFGRSEEVLKAIPTLEGLLSVAAVYGLVRWSRGPGPALLAALLYATVPSLLKWSFDARGGYAECQLLIPLVFWLLLAEVRGESSWMRGLLLGLLSGFSIYLLQLSTPVALTVLVVLALDARNRRSWTPLFAWIPGFLVGVSPLLLVARPSGAVGFAPMPLLARAGQLPGSLYRTVFLDLPSLFSYDNFEGPAPPRLLPNGFECGVVLLLIAVLCWRFRWKGSLREGRVEAVLGLYVVLYLLLYSLHPLAGGSPRYLLFLEPALSVLAGLGLVETLSWGRWGMRAGIVLLALALIDRGAQVIQLSGDDRIYGPDGPSEPSTAEVMIDFLRSRGLDKVVTEDWDLGWRIAFKTSEQVSVAHNLNNLHQRPPFAAVVDQGSESDKRVREFLEKRGDLVERYILSGKTIYVVGGSRASG